MKVQDAKTGAHTTTSVDEYAAEVARRLGARIRVMAAESPTGVFPSPEAMADLMSDVIAPETEGNELASLLGPFWSQEKVAAELADLGGPAKTRSALMERRKNGTLLGLLTTDRKTIYPVSQFQREGSAIVVKPGVRSVLSVLRNEDPWAVALLLRTPAPELGGKTPLDLMRSDAPGVDEKLVALAKQVRSEWRK